MAATPDATSVAGSRRAETSVSKASAKPGSLESSRIRQASGRPAEGVDHRRDFGRAGLEGGAVDDEARGHLCDLLHLHKAVFLQRATRRSEEHTSELQSLMRISYASFALKKKRT